jgi:processive 1,2-diacylglycerol beta-glucosyltransferase
MRVLILTASYGSGHNRVADTLAATLCRAGAKVTVVDHFRELVHPAFERATRVLYEAVLRRAPAVWGAAYWTGDRIPVTSRLGLGSSHLGMGKLARLLDSLRPDHVVAVHPTPAGALGGLRARGRPTSTLTTVFTDFGAHTQWIQPGVDRYCVPAEEVAHELTAHGVRHEHVAVTGVPVAEAFSRPGARAATRLALGLSARAPVVLLMDGLAGGFGRIEAAVRVVLEMAVPLQAVAVAGRNPALERRLRRVVQGREDRVKVLGFVHGIRDLMAAADILVTKAGGLTLAEALAAELPVICFGSLPGQEKRNERFAAMAGVALVAGSPRQLRSALGAALGDAAVLESMRMQARAHGRPEAATRVAALVLGEGAAAEREGAR